MELEQIIKIIIWGFILILISNITIVSLILLIKSDIEILKKLIIKRNRELT